VVGSWIAIETQVPNALDVHLILDNYGTHKTAIIRNSLVKRPRFQLHFTPTYGSWLNLERWFAELPNKQMRRGFIGAPLSLRPPSSNSLTLTTGTPSRSSGQS